MSTTIDSTAKTSAEMVRSAATTALRVASRNYLLYDTGDVAGVDEVFVADLIDHNPVAGAASGIAGMRYLIAEVRDGFTDTEHRILFQQELAEGWVVNHWNMTATHTGEAFGLAASGKPVSMNGTDIVRVVDGKITEIYHVEELLQFTLQVRA
ncbi:ester cyclase [Nocardia sp. NPDC051052]|uniref:ester cyclase n=1 Tax=Nocardia sp. NPDC051052 TaxID=3364322 RepID=UPI00379487F9